MGQSPGPFPRPMLALLSSCICAVASQGTVYAQEPTELAPEVLREAQLASLRSVYFRDTPAPPPPTPEELAGLSTLFASAPDEAEELIELFGEQPELLVYATRDSDGDGVFDYRVSELYGKFLEGDIDVDGDGVDNGHDAHPYDPTRGGSDENGDGAPDPGSFVDVNRNGLADHIDWRSRGKGDVMAEVQERLFREHRILLVERSAEFTPSLALAVLDAVTSVFDDLFETRGSLPALRTVATEESCLLTPEVDDETNAMASATTRTLRVYRIGIEYPALVQLGLLVHELAHNYQYSLDFDVGDPRSENVRVYYPAPRFHALVEPFGWQAEQLVFDPTTDGYRIFTPHYFELSPFYTWRGDTPEKWARWLARRYRRAGDGYLEDPKVVENGIVGDYSLTDPWEWHSDNLIAYTFLSIEDRVRATMTGDELARAIEAMLAASREAWPAFRWENLDRAEIGAHFRERFPFEPADLDAIVERYVRPLMQP